ncbi:MAG: HD domain-containing protein, partial [Deltaproteobacteria bacterium]|nr:HD domain-containing protein [Deltaproteobacteria bacterium]
MGDELILLKENLNERERRNLSPYATLSTEALRRQPEERLLHGHRQEFSVDADRILHSQAYTRYIDKTQVFSLIKNDHITHRVLHVQLVSKVGRTIGRYLGLNEDLIEAIALGHDIGHPPFGHDGEGYLSEICVKHGIGAFQHNIQSVRFLEKIEHKGRGWNLSLQVLDGILCHDGEVHSARLAPQKEKTFSALEQEMESKRKNPMTELIP